MIRVSYCCISVTSKALTRKGFLFANENIQDVYIIMVGWPRCDGFWVIIILRY